MVPRDCIDEDMLADLFACGANAASRDEVEQHLDACADCRALVAAYARAADDMASEDVEPSRGENGGVSPFAATLPSDASPPIGADASKALPGQLLGNRYLLERVIGEGGMGIVWAARDLRGDRRVALKILKEGSPELARRSWREARAAAHVGHPSLIEVIDVLAPTHAHEAPVIVMPLLEGESLDRLLARRSRIDSREALELLEPVVSGMHAAHARGVIHRDLKPANVFLAEDGSGARTVVVLDFGLAKILSEDGSDAAADKLTRTGALLGTPWYMAPEQLFGDASVDQRADVWAIGAILYECVTGRRPIEGRSYGQIARNVGRGTITPISEIAYGIDPALALLTSRMLDKDREGRPDLAEVHAVFRALLDG